jgi:hypothetical protein
MERIDVDATVSARLDSGMYEQNEVYRLLQ